MCVFFCCCLESKQALISHWVAFIDIWITGTQFLHKTNATVDWRGNLLREKGQAKIAFWSKWIIFYL